MIRNSEEYLWVGLSDRHLMNAIGEHFVIECKPHEDAPSDLIFHMMFSAQALRVIE
jgi:hypothetical protein